MWWQYFLVFLGAFLFDVVPFPFPPAFTIMVTLQIIYNLNTWLVIIIGVLGSIIGRYLLTLYIPILASKYFNPKKNKEVQFLGNKMKEKGWKSQLLILTYSLLPLPTTPLFLAGGMAHIKPIQIIPAFFIGKFTSDAFLVHFGMFATENMEEIINKSFSIQSIFSLIFCLILIGALLFVDWFTLFEKKKIIFNFKIWK